MRQRHALRTGSVIVAGRSLSVLGVVGVAVIDPSAQSIIEKWIGVQLQLPTSMACMTRRLAAFCARVFALLPTMLRLVGCWSRS